MRSATVLALNGIKRGIRNRTVILLGVVGPLVLGGVLALAFGGNGPSVHIGLVDLDGSGVSRGVVTGLEQAFHDGGGNDSKGGDDSGDDKAREDGTGREGVGGEADSGGSGPSVELDSHLSASSLDEVRQRVDDGVVEAAVVIPKGYGRSVTAIPSDGGAGGSRGRLPEELQVVTSSANPVSSGVATGIAHSVAQQTDLTRAVAEALVQAGHDPTAAISGDVSRVISVKRGTFSGDFDAPLFLGPLAVFLFLSLSVSAKSFVRDEQSGVLDRIRASPLSSWSLVAGSAASVFVIGAIASTVVVLSTVVFGASWGDPVDVAAILFAFVVSVAGLLGLISGVASTEAQADSWTNLLAFGFAIIGGSFFGGALLPGVLGTIGSFTPNGASMVALLNAGPGGRGLGGVWPYIVWMLVLGVAGITFGGVMLKRRLQ